MKKLATKAENSKTYSNQRIVKLQKRDLSFFIGQSYFFNDGAQFYSIFQTLYYTIKRIGDIEKVVLLRSKGLSTKKLTTPTTTYSLYPSIKWY